eukprot:CAMPEP_0116919352 /NCGR_PEP_ID=MMETSP0467-20121206/20332_1 /TAXON_ID=283647 /ORGANISM="Mesodinium pulex, Strain SPMC105" /LENGTH=59 /DNA_ID=CAMNT_0004596909 /DNA_START=383 /DNA_END=562 /DNA_ORIENTATION=+
MIIEEIESTLKHKTRVDLSSMQKLEECKNHVESGLKATFSIALDKKLIDNTKLEDNELI